MVKLVQKTPTQKTFTPFAAPSDPAGDCKVLEWRLFSMNMIYDYDISFYFYMSETGVVW